jgi:hypothetical protein
MRASHTGQFARASVDWKQCTAQQRIAYLIGSIEHILFEFGFEDMMERRKSKIIEMALHVAEEAEHPMNQHLVNRRAYD